MPGFIKPQLATRKTKAPTGDQWLNEIKFDGYRARHVTDKKDAFDLWCEWAERCHYS